MYQVEPLIGHAEPKYVHRREILDARYLVKDMENVEDDDDYVVIIQH
jgi:hypothetical protein